METSQKTEKLSATIKNLALINKPWIPDLRSFEIELDYLDKLFMKASFLMVKQDFDKLSYLRQNYSDLRIKMSKYLQQLKFNVADPVQNVVKPIMGTDIQLENELNNLLMRLQAFKNDVFYLNKPKSGMPVL